MSTLPRQPALPNVIQEIREALMRPVLEASHRRVPNPQGRVGGGATDQTRRTAAR